LGTSIFASQVDDKETISLIYLRTPIFTPFQRILKRVLDISLSLTLCLILAPIMAIIYIIVKYDSPGPAIISQQRIGQFGKPFAMYKFRSMYVESGADISMVTYIKTADDSRITPAGRIIRRWSLDELPQLVNVIRGDMSLVGPRPELPHIVENYETWQTQRFEVPQGMTGWWQVNGRSDLPMFDNTSYDLHYIENYSIRLDIYILFKTISVVIRGRGAY